MGVMGTAAAGHAAEEYDTPLAQQILAAVQNYRRSVQEMLRLEQTLQQKTAPKDVFDSPAMKDFIRDSIDPSYAQLKYLFGRYRDEIGVKALKTFADQQGFADLLEHPADE
jgi:hypothetical protein